MASVYEGNIPQPLQNIGCQDLLKTENTFSGWLRKRHFVNKLKIFNWPQVYVILSKGCIYYFKNEYSKTALGKFSFYGYNRSKGVAPKQGPWAFQVVHTHKDDFKTYYFAAPSEREMKEWMKHVKGTLVEANGKTTEYYYTYRKAAQESKDKLIDDESVTYHEIETNIYGDTPAFVVDQDYKTKYAVKGKDEESDEEDEPPEPPARPSTLPPSRRDNYDRPPLPLPTPSPENTLNNSAKGLPLPNIPANIKDSLPDPPEDQPPVPSRRDNAPTKDKHKKKTKHEPVTKKNSGGGNTTEYLKAGHVKKTEQVVSDPEPVPETSPINTDGDEEGSYWDDIYYNDEDAEKASCIIRQLQTDGTFLVRSATRGNNKVLVVYAENNLKKYQINQDENKQFYLKKDGLRADTLEELIYEYHIENLPTCNVKLQQPYLHHPKYKEIR